jgi:hypothetical protein
MNQWRRSKEGLQHLEQYRYPAAFAVFAVLRIAAIGSALGDQQ